MTLQKIVLLDFALGYKVELSVVTAFEFAHKEVAWVGIAVNSDLRVRHSSNIMVNIIQNHRDHSFVDCKAKQSSSKVRMLLFLNNSSIAFERILLSFDDILYFSRVFI
jgi:phosphoribosylanthranilate isomerase